MHPRHQHTARPASRTRAKPAAAPAMHAARSVNAAVAAAMARDAELRALEWEYQDRDDAQDLLDAERLIDGVAWRER